MLPATTIYASPPTWCVPPSAPRLSTAEVHVWRAALDDIRSPIEDFWGLLSPDEIERAGRLRFPADRQRFVARRAVLRLILARYLRKNPASLVFEYSSLGRPSLAGNYSGVCFSLSHSGGLALYAIALRRGVGVDLECLRTSVSYDAIAERFFAPGENAALRCVPSELRRELFFACWTQKEAYVKARGEGLGFGLDRFEVPLFCDNPQTVSHPDESGRNVPRWWMQMLFPGDGFSGAVVVEGDAWRLRCWQYPV